MNLKMVKSGLVLACVALAQWVSAQQAPQMEALPIDPNVRYGVLGNGRTDIGTTKRRRIVQNSTLHKR